MRFKIKQKEKLDTFVVGRKGPEIGTKKIITRYAFLPTKLNEKEYIWLEKYIEIWTYQSSLVKKYFVDEWRTYQFMTKPYSWVSINKWVLIEKKDK